MINTGAHAQMINSTPPANDSKETLYMQLKDGVVEIQLRPDLAPNHVARVKELVGQGFYDGLTFHRVIDGFMAQGGDPLGTGTGGSGKKIDAEFSDAPHTRGAVSMARANDPNSADSQFFIVLKDSNFLDKQYTVWGYVTKGMEFVDNIKKGNPADNGSVSNPDKIVSLSLAKPEGAAEAPAAEAPVAEDAAKADAVKETAPPEAVTTDEMADEAMHDEAATPAEEMPAAHEDEMPATGTAH